MSPAEARRALRRDARAVEKSIKQSLRKTQRTVTSEIVKEINALTSMKKAALKRKILKSQLRSASGSHKLKITIQRYAPNLINYKPRPYRGSSTTRGGLKVAIYNRRVAVAGAFMGNAKSTVFKRTGDARLPIISLPGPSAYRTFLNHKSPRMLSLFRSTTLARFEIEYERALAFNMRSN